MTRLPALVRALTRPVRTVVDRVVRGPWAPSEADVGSTGFVSGALSGGFAVAVADGRGLVLLLVGWATGVVLLAIRDRTNRRDRRDGYRP